MRKIALTAVLGLVIVLAGFNYSFVLADETSTTPTQDSSSTTSTDTGTPSIPQPISINLDIEAATSTLFNGPLSVSACSPDASGTFEVTGYCAVKQSGLASDWAAYGSDQFLNSVGGVGNDYVNNFYWGWFVNLEYGQTALNKHQLDPGENLLLTLSRMPLKIGVSTTTPPLNGTTTVTVLQFGLDSSWSPVWTPASSSSIELAGQNFSVNASGTYDLLITTTTPFSIKASEPGFLDSSLDLISPLASDSSPTPTSTATTTDTTNRSGGGSGSSIVHHNLDVNKAISFLLANQKPDGSFDSPYYTDWAAIAFASYPQNSGLAAIQNYLKNENYIPSNPTDPERHAMALEAVGIDPRNGTPVNYIQKIIDSFDGTQVGDASSPNKDIFAIFPLLRAGYSPSDEIIQKITTSMIREQSSDGSFGSVDMTAAAIQALSLVQTNGTQDTLNKAKAYLASHQNSDGGFGTVGGTSWTLQAIAALGQSGSDWTQNGNDPNDYLFLNQSSDGGMDAATINTDTRAWDTAFAIPAALGRTWNSILNYFPKTQIQNTSSGALAITDTSTLLVATTTSSAEISTTTVTTTIKILTDTPKTERIAKQIPNEDRNSGIAPQNKSQNETSNLTANVLSSNKNSGGLNKNLVYVFSGLIAAGGIFVLKKKTN